MWHHEPVCWATIQYRNKSTLAYQDVVATCYFQSLQCFVDWSLLPAGDSPQIISIHTDPLGKKNIETGGTVTICCTATGDPPLRYTWLFTSSPKSSATVLPNEDEPTLVIRAAKENDHQGSYQCRVTNVFGQVTSDLDSLKIKVGELDITKVFILLILHSLATVVS